MNPAYIIRQMMNDYSKLYGIKGRITSLKYLYEGNKPDDWEEKALKSFELGNMESLEYENINNKPYLRFMRPMVTEESCLKCHAHQGYKVGDIRGGVGVSVPIESLNKLSEHQQFVAIFGHLAVWLLVLISMFFLSFRESSRLEKQKEMERSHKENEAKLEEQRLQGQKMESIGTLAGGIAHDLNNILGVIMGYTEMTLDDLPDTKEAQGNLNSVMKASERAKNMVNQILAFSRKANLTKVPLNLVDLIKETIDFLKSSIPSSIAIISNLENCEHQINANATQINQVLMNLCTNASYAMKDSGGVLKINVKEIALDEESSRIFDVKPGILYKLTISDNGSGMNKETLQSIFEPYFTTKDTGEGSGMGLAVVYGIVRDHGGKIDVYSEPGVGTTFTIYFPVLSSEKTEELNKNRRTSIIGNKEMILFVDDEESLVALGTKMLEKLGYRVENSTNSIDALEVFKAAPDKFDLIVTDMTMPKMSGITLAAEIHKIRMNIPVILCTGFSASINEKNFISKGLSALIMKPLVKRELGEAISKVLNKEKKP